MPYLILISLALVLAACGGTPARPLPTPDAENVIYVTATEPLPTPNADGVIVITATPDAQTVAQQVNTPVQVVASATPEPLPTEPVEVADSLAVASSAEADNLMSSARQLLTNGYYEQAVQAYQAIVAQAETVPANQRAEAAFRTGQAAVKEGLFSDAVEALTLLITQFPDHERVPQAHFLRGDAYLGLSQWQAAVDDFTQFLALRPGLLDSYAYERMGDAQFSLGQTQAALASYAQALNGSRPLVSELILRERYAQILINLGDTDGAVAQYDAILNVAQNAPYRASIDFSSAQALIAGGEMERGLLRARRVFDQHPTTRPAYQAMQILLENDVELDGLQRGRVAYYYGDYQTAIDAFNDFSSNNLLEEIPAELYLMLGRAYREIGNPDAANIAFQTIIDQYRGDALLGDALLEQGRTRFLSGDIPGAIQIYSSVAANYTQLTETAAEALWRVGYLYGTRDNPVQSRETFVQLAQTYPQSSWASNGLLLAASAAVKSQEWQVAENLYARIAAIATGEDQAAAWLWVGRLALQRGDNNAAQDAFSRAAVAAPDSYFAARALDIQQGVDAFQPPASVQFTFNEAAEKAQAEAWLRSTFTLEDAPADLAALPPELANDPRVLRGAELWALASYDEANDEFDALLDEARASRDALTAYRMAVYLQELGAYYMSIVAAADVIVAAGVPTLDAPAYIARMRYPAYYIDLIMPQAQQYGFDPLLLLGMIRQESLFDAEAVSIADAIGLMQVIPSTAQYIAGQVGFTDFQISDLTRPYVSVQFGSFYISEQLRLFDGNAAAALAAYNGGPGNALDWVALSGGEVDLLVTTITFDETRSYVQRIYSHHAIYRELYGVGN